MAGDACLPEVWSPMRENESILAMCERHVVEGEARVARQMEIIAKLEQGNHLDAAVTARGILEVFLRSLELSAVHLAAERGKPPP